MNWFFISPFSINILNVAILLVFMLFFLFRIERKLVATRYLIASLIGVELVFISFFVIFSAFDPFYSTVAWWIMHLMVFASIAMVQFAYHYPKNLHHRESKIALYLCTALAFAAYPFYIYKTLTTEPLYSFEAYAYVFLNRPEMGVIIGSEIVWMLVVFFRKAVLLSEYEYSGSLNKWSGLARHPARFWIACMKILKARGRETRAIRQLIVIFFSPVILIAAIILAYQGLISWEIVAHILGTGFMVIAFIFIIVYINNSSEPSTFMVKLIGISLGALLVAISFGAGTAITIQDSAYEKERIYEVREAMKGLSKSFLTDLPHAIAYILEKSPTAEYKAVYSRDPAFPERLRNERWREELSLPLSEPVRRYRKLAPLDGKDYYIHYDFPFNGKIYEVGFDYIPYRQAIADTGMKLIYIIIASVLFVIIVFPYFFADSLVKPLNVLLGGVEKVNKGDLKVVVPVKVEDEIGYLSESFNSMVESIKDGREKLRGALEKQVKLTESYSFFVPKELITSRLEGLTKLYGSPVILSKTTLEKTENLSNYNHRYLDRVQVQGKSSFVDIYEVFESDPIELRELKIETKESFEMATEYYRTKQFDKALRYFRDILKINSRDKAAEVYVKRCENIRKHGLPEGWEGVTVLAEK